MNITLDPQSTAFCLASFIERERLRVEILQANQQIADLSKKLELTKNNDTSEVNKGENE